MFGWSILKKDRERKDDPRRPSEAGSTVSRTERSKSIAESKRDSMVEPNSKRASIVEQGVVKSSSVAGEEIGVAGQSPTTARTLVPVAEETKPEKKSETEAIKEETTAEASSTSAATPPPVVPEPSPASLAIQQPDVVVTYPSTGDVANKNPEANQ